MKRFLSVLCVLAMLLSIVPVAAFAAAQDLQALIDSGADEPIVLEADASGITVTRDTYVDLNGHDINGVTVLSGTLYCLDSQTADYTVADGVYGKVTNATGAVKAAEGYLQVGESFHAVNLDIYAMTLRAADVGVYYKSNFAADEIVAAQVESFGVALSVVTAPNASNMDSYCGYSVFEGFEAGEGANSVGTSTLLKGIMKASNGDSKNAKNASMPVYGRAYIKTADGYFFGETVKRSLQEQVEAIDKIWNSLTDSQKNPVLGLLESYTSVMESWNIPNIMGIQVPGAEGEIEIDVPVNAENGTVTEAVTVEQDGVSVTVPAGTKLSEGAEKLTVTVTPKEVSDAGLTLEESEVLMPMDVHVDGLAADNAAPLTIYLGKVMAENLNMGNYAVYHVENGKANEMTLIGVNEEFTAHNQYKYTLDGELTLYMATFSEVAVVSEDPKWEGKRDYSWYNTTDTTLYIRNADQLAAFGAIVGDMAKTADKVDIAQDSFENKTVVLLADIDLNDAEENNQPWIFHPIGYWNNEGTYERKPLEERTAAVRSGFYAFMGTFDGNGNTISNFYHNTWEIKGDHNWYDTIKEQYFRDGMGLFGKVYGGTVKNLTVSNFSSDGEITTTGVIAAYADCGATFKNIAIFDCNPRVYNIGNGGIVGCVGWYTEEVTDKKVTFENISVDQSNKISALWGTYDVSCGGLVGQYYATSGQGDGYANAGMSFTNCHVAAVMDVHNDVCANYQYYWYRYSGMMIGTIRANKKDAAGYTVADTTGITFTDCTYTLGEWNEYWYCELVKNSLASYTHDHQFSRLTKIADVSEIQDEKGNWNVEGNFVIPNAENTAATCYHIFKNSKGNLYRHYHNEADESNPNPYENFDVNGDGDSTNDLKEDRQCYFMPFNQVFNGLGYGVKPTYEFTGITEVKDGTVKAVEKFDALLEQNSYIAIDATKKISELFAPKTGVNVSEATIHVFVSPVGEDSTVEATYACVTDGYMENASITFKGEGAAKITITDYYFCTSTVLYVIIGEAQPVVKFAPVENVTVTSGNTVTLGELFTAVAGVTIDSANVSIAGEGFDYTLNTTDWTQSTVTFNSGVNKPTEVTLTITDNNLCVESKTTVTVEPVPVQKFEAKLTEVDAEQSYTLRQLFSYVDNGIAVQDAAVSVTGDNVTYTQAAAWEDATVAFNKAGTVTLTITDNYYCTATEVTIAVNTIDKFALVFENTDEYLYRVGNAKNSPVALNLLFKALDGVTINSADVEFTTVAGNASASYTEKTPWTSGTIQFSNTGVIKVTISTDNANPLSLNLEVVNATNHCSATISSLSGSTVLLCDTKLNSGGSLSLTSASLYGNGFEMDMTAGKTQGVNSSSNYLLNLSGSTIDNVKLVGAVYTKYGAGASDEYNIPVIRSSGRSAILNSYIANCAAPVRLASGDLRIVNSTLKGGNFANLDIRNGNVVLDNVTTINQVEGNDLASDGTVVVGLGVVSYYENVSNETTITIKNGITQYNHLSKAQSDKYIKDTYAKQLMNVVFQNSSVSNMRYTDSAGTVWVNTGILSMSAEVGDNNITDVPGFSSASAIFGGKTGFVHAKVPTAASIGETVPGYVTAGQGTIAPECDFAYYGDSEDPNYKAKDETNDYCYQDGGIVYISMDEGDTFDWNPNILNAEKNGTKLSYAVSMNGIDYIGKKIAFNQDGDYTVVYSYQDPYNYAIDANGNIITYSEGYEASVTIKVAVVKDTTVHATFTFGADKTATEKITIGNNTYVSAKGVAADNEKWGSVTVEGQTIIFPITSAEVVDKKYAYFYLFADKDAKNIVSITDDSDTIYDSATKSKPNNLTVVNGNYNSWDKLASGKQWTNWTDLNDTSKYQSGTASNYDPEKYTGNDMAGKVFSYAAAEGTYASEQTRNNRATYRSPSLTNKRAQYYTIAKFCYTDLAGMPHYYYIGYNIAAKAQGSDICVTPNTLVTMSDGTQKEIQYVTYEDEVLVWNFYTGKYEFAPVSLLIDHGDSEYEIVDLQFSDGTNLEIVGCHGVFNKTKGEFVDISAENVEGFVGDTFLKQSNDGFEEVVLAGYEVRIERNGSYTILSAGNHNAILNGMLTLSPSLLAENLYEPFVIGEDMKYDEAQMQADIEAYGLYTYEDFAEYITYEQFEAWGLAAMKVTVGKGYTTYENIVILLQTIALPNA